MILQALADVAIKAGLVQGMAIRKRLVHLVLRIDPDGQIASTSPWIVLTRTVPGPKNTTKEEPGAVLEMPEYPGVNAGGKAHFLADSVDKILGVSGKSGEPIPDDGKNAAKAFLHYWKRIEDAFAETGDAELSAMLKFRDRYLKAGDRRAALEAIVGFEPVGKDPRPTFATRSAGQPPQSLDGRTMTFRVGNAPTPVFADDSALRGYWEGQFRKERFAATPADAASGRGTCLVTGEENVPIAEVHRTTIKGVPGLPPIGGYLVSFASEAPSLASYGFEGGWNSPVSEDVALAYALGLNHLLATPDSRKKIGESVVCSWIDTRPEAGGVMLNLLDAPTAESRTKFFERLDLGQPDHAIEAEHYRSLTLSANGGRVVVRRWLDVPLKEAVDAAKRWFQDLDVEEIEVPRAAGKPSKRRPSNSDEAPSDAFAPETPRHSPYAILPLAWATVRVPKDAQSTTFDALYRAALDPRRFNPHFLLSPALDRLRIAAAERGSGVRFDTSRFALLKLILVRIPHPEGPPMPIERTLCETADRPYNCGRLLAVLDDLQRAAQGPVNADIVSRFYGGASTYPGSVFPRLLDLAKVHTKKLQKSPEKKKQARGWALMARIDDIAALIRPTEGKDVAEFPSLLTVEEQGRFALGFHQQKAADARSIKAYLAAKAAGQKPAEDAVLEALADVTPANDSE